MMNRLYISILLSSALAHFSNAWTSNIIITPPSPSSLSSPRTHRGPSSTSLQASVSDRRAFVTGATAVLLVSSTLPVFAEGDKFDDLAMPSADESKQAEDEMAERLRRKAELQRKASRPMTYGASLQSEKEKQKDLQKSKEERRNALCEELGRGC